MNGKTLGEACSDTSNIKWKENSGNSFQYIDLTSVDRSKNSISETQTIYSNSAPSRAQKMVRKNDVIFGTTRPTLKRYCVIEENYDGQICSTGFCVLRPDTEKVLTNFIYHLLGTLTFYKLCRSISKGCELPRNIR